MRFPAVLFSLISITASAQDVLLQQKAARLYKTGVELMAQNQFSAARENFNQYLSLSPATGNQKQDAEYYKAICSLNLYHVDAEKQLQDFIENNPSSAKASVAYADLATFFYNEKNYKKAATYFGKADFDALSPSEQNTARFRWGYSLFSQKILKEALDQFNYIKASGGQYGPAASYYAGFAEYSTGDFVNALTDLKRAEQAEAYANLVPFMIANVYYKQKDYDALISYAQTVVGRKDLANAEEIALLSAEAYYKKGD
jgi:tetratricopeptide (TPR) repeat protein